MIEKLKELKERIAKGKVSDADIDTVNGAIDYINWMEEKSEATPAVPTQEDFCMEPLNGIHVNIQSATIHIYTTENK